MYRSSYTAVFPKPSAEKIQYLYDQIHLNIFETFKLVEQEFKWVSLLFLKYIVFRAWNNRLMMYSFLTMKIAQRKSNF